jgi:peptide/nickel transport system substrate-binding protein
MILTIPLSFISNVAATGPATDTIIFVEVDKNLAAQAVKSGDIDYYIFGLTPGQVEILSGDSDYIIYGAPSSQWGIGVNPAPSDERFNPFTIREVRFGLNYLADRSYIANQIFQGAAEPMYTFLSPYDPDYVTIYDIIAENEFGYDLTTAASIIDPALTNAGCTKVEGKWTKDGELVTIKFLIRTKMNEEK